MPVTHTTNSYTEADVTALCLSLIDNHAKLTPEENAWIKQNTSNATPKPPKAQIVNNILQGNDPLHTAFCLARNQDKRRIMGQTNTPIEIVQSILHWLQHQENPDRIIDCGSGSGRFSYTAARLFPNAKIIAIEKDPLIALILRANLAVLGISHRVEILVQDYQNTQLPNIRGTTAFIGNPPYVRHHDISQHWKAWFTNQFEKLGITASGLAGLHLHFFLKTYLLAKNNDIGAFITSAEWLDVNYGASLRKLLTNQLGGTALHVLTPKIEAFPGTATTAAITCFRVGEKKSPVKVRYITKLPKLNSLTDGRNIARKKLANAPRWSSIIHNQKNNNGGEIPLGTYFAVHRGQVTGANAIWIADQNAQNLPERVLLPTVTKAKELIQAGPRLITDAALHRVIDIPANLEQFDTNERKNINDFLNWAKKQGAENSYIAKHRKAWWSGHRADFAALCTRPAW